MLFSEPKIPQCAVSNRSWGRTRSFSALQRAENSSIRLLRDAGFDLDARFSALQRAENSSISQSLSRRLCPRSFQCSSASRKFLNALCFPLCLHTSPVSVLFSEPKIPQFGREIARDRRDTIPFQCSSASRKFLNPVDLLFFREIVPVSVLFSEPKIPQ